MSNHLFRATHHFNSAVVGEERQVELLHQLLVLLVTGKIKPPGDGLNDWQVLVAVPQYRLAWARLLLQDWHLQALVLEWSSFHAWWRMLWHTYRSLSMAEVLYVRPASHDNTQKGMVETSLPFT